MIVLILYLIIFFKVQAVQDVAYCFNELRTYIQPSIKIYLLNCLEFYLDLLLKTSLYYTRKVIEANINILRVKPDCIQPADLSLFDL